jgi:hypothetical protein
VHRTATGVFATYKVAGDVVRELELVGIAGAEVELLTDAGDDLRAEDRAPGPEDPQKMAGGYTLVIVHPADDVGFEQAKGVMDRYGAERIQIDTVDDGAAVKCGSVWTTPGTSISGPGVRDRMDNDVPGKEFKISETGGVPRKRRRKV